MKLWLIILLLLGMFATNLCAELPGMKIRLSRAGIQYAANVATDQLSRQVTTLSIPDISGDTDVWVGRVDYTFSNIRVEQFRPPSTSISTAPFNLALHSTSISLIADWRYEYKEGFIHISDDGSVNVDINLDLDVGIGLSTDQTGRPQISTQSCACNVAHVDVHFHGGASWLYDLFDGVVEDKIADVLKGQICDAVKKEIDNDAEKQLQKMDVTVLLDNTIVLDYSLVDNPTQTTQYIDFDLKGEFYWMGEQPKYPLSPQPISGPAEDRMLTFCITDYAINTLGYTEYKHGILHYNVTMQDLRTGGYILETTCKSILKPCIGALVPQIGQRFPNASVGMTMQVTQAPTLHLASPNTIYGQWDGLVDFNLLNKDLKYVQSLFSVQTQANFSLEVTMAGSLIQAKVKNCSAHMTIDKSNIGKVNVDALNTVLKFAINTFVIPKLNKLGAVGIVLPTIDHVQYSNTAITIKDNALYLGVNLQYSP